MSVAEVLGFANTTLKTGQLAFRLAGGVRKSLWLKDGQVVFAASTDPDDRLGPAFLRAGLITLAQLEGAETLVREGKKLGSALVEKGFVRPTDVYAGVARQVRHIVLTLFDAAEGQFSLGEGPVEPPSEVKLPERTRELLLEGLKRAELVARVSALVPDGDARLEALPGKEPPPPGPEAVLLSVVDGSRTVREAIAASRLGTFDGLLAVGAAIEAGRARTSAGVRPVHVHTFAKGETGPKKAAPPAATPPAEEPEATAGGGPFEAYRRAIQRIFEVVREHTTVGQANLELFLLDPPRSLEKLLDGVSLSTDGVLDVEKLRKNAEAAHREGGRARALEALEQFLAYATFEAKNLLPDAAAKKLLREVANIQLGRR